MACTETVKKALGNHALWYHFIDQFCTHALTLFSCYLLLPYFRRVFHASTLQIMIVYIVNFVLVLLVEIILPALLSRSNRSWSIRFLKGVLVFSVFFMSVSFVLIFQVSNWLHFNENSSNFPAILLPGSLFCLSNICGQIFSIFAFLLFPEKGLKSGGGRTYTVESFFHAHELGGFVGMLVLLGSVWIPFNLLTTINAMIIIACVLGIRFLFVLYIWFSKFDPDIDVQDLGSWSLVDNISRFCPLKFTSAIALLLSCSLSATFSSLCFFAIDWILSLVSSSGHNINFTELMSSAISKMFFPLIFGLLLRFILFFLLKSCSARRYHGFVMILFSIFMVVLIVGFTLPHFFPSLDSTFNFAVLLSLGFSQLFVFWNFFYPSIYLFGSTRLTSTFTSYWKIDNNNYFGFFYRMNELVRFLGLTCGVIVYSLIINSSPFLKVYTGLVALSLVLLITLFFSNICLRNEEKSDEKPDEKPDDKSDDKSDDDDALVQSKNMHFKGKSSIIFRHANKFP